MLNSPRLDVGEKFVSIGICIIAHAPLASALKACSQHIYSTTDSASDDIVCFDVPADCDVAAGTAVAADLIEGLKKRKTNVLVFTDLLGATPSNIAHSFLDDPAVRVVTGVNLPAVITALSAPEAAPVNQVMTLAEGAAHAGISSSVGRKEP